MAATPVLLVDDDPDLRQLLAIRLRSAGYAPITAASGAEALGSLAASRPAAVITDLRMDGMDGLSLFERIRAQDPALPVIILTAHGTIPDAVDATQRGVFGFLTKPFEASELLALLARAVALQPAPPAAAAAPTDAWRADILTASPRMLALLSEAALVARSQASVLIRGESGTGKELLARAIHRASPRQHGPFVAINCAAIPETLLESELFGHARGAFTGAAQAQTGLFQQAHGGTLFLDEIGDMPLPLQVKLLRVLQEREFQRLGSSETVRVDIRVIAASNADLVERIRQGRFREDLYYRLNVVPLHMPPLRERAADIPLLVDHFLMKVCRREGLPLKQVRAAALERLIRYDWPGNVRQLENAVEMAVALSGERRMLEAADFPLPSSLPRAPLANEAAPVVALPENGLDYEQVVSAFERNLLEQALRRAGGNKKRAADLLRLKRTTLSAKLRSLQSRMAGAA